MPRTTAEKLSRTTGSVPNAAPATVSDPTHSAAPAQLNAVKVGHGMRATPATNGANVRTIGTKRASTTVRGPWAA
jgi:hypothetical protein